MKLVYKAVPRFCRFMNLKNSFNKIQIIHTNNLVVYFNIRKIALEGKDRIDHF